ncbi:DUF6344 domain-containing protein [Streptomyces sp. MA5143a]|uniref:DUF6344 domain-containing protein n=1 Tax=Streptomyces sp. MA5143a TaxID=2083010 RepID=UPI000D1BC062|nr:DUF6344 domain-containing protein [Streptomyces sp. MA5143a]SPF01725.1 hypothetical protein SMA5143A_2461 [Streptomyces sp. MA5143a]
MAQNKVMKLWTTIVTAFLALCTALGLITATAAAAVPQPETHRNCAARPTIADLPLVSRPRDRALPPTMKQRIRAEAHGSSPSCRHLTALDSPPDATSALTVPPAAPEAPPAPNDPLTRLQR